MVSTKLILCGLSILMAGGTAIVIKKFFPKEKTQNTSTIDNSNSSSVSAPQINVEENPKHCESASEEFKSSCGEKNDDNNCELEKKCTKTLEKENK